MAKSGISQLISEEAGKLRSYTGSGSVVSVYISSDAPNPAASFFVSQFRSLVHSSVLKADRALVEPDLAQLQHVLDGRTGSAGKGIAAFAAAGRLLAVFDLPFLVPNTIVISPRPFLEPLDLPLALNRCYLVALVSRQRARLSLLEMHELRDVAELASEVPQRAKKMPRDRQFGRDAKTDRHIQEHLREHLKTIVAALGRLQREHKPHGLLIASHTELIPQLAELLPAALRSKLIVGFKADDDVSNDWLRDKSLEAIAAAIQNEPTKITGAGPARRSSKR